MKAEVFYFSNFKKILGTSAYKSGLEKIFFQKIGKITKKLSENFSRADL